MSSIGWPEQKRPTVEFEPRQPEDVIAWALAKIRVFRLGG